MFGRIPGVCRGSSKIGPARRGWGGYARPAPRPAAYYSQEMARLRRISETPTWRAARRVCAVILGPLSISGFGEEGNYSARGAGMRRGRAVKTTGGEIAERRAAATTILRYIAPQSVGRMLFYGYSIRAGISV